jgi:hypothetical protein
MELRFIRGTREAPRGHAMIIVRPYGQARSALATYCIVLPITFSIGRYIPPILASQLPAEGLRDMGNGPSVMPIPPMLEDVDDVESLIALAEVREDDVVEIMGLTAGHENQRMELAALTCAEYQDLYQRYTANRHPTTRANEPALANPADSLPATPLHPSEPDPLDTLLNPASPVADVDQLKEIAMLISTLRYAQEGHDEHLVDETKRALRRAIAPLAEKYRAAELLTAAAITGPRGQQLTDLYLTRAYRLAAEDYSAIPALEQQIQELTSQG